VRSNLFDMQKSRLVAKRRKPAFWFRVMVANQTAVWLGGRQSQLVGVVAGRPLSFDILSRSPSFWRRCDPAFLGGHRALDGSDIASCAELSMFGVPSAVFLLAACSSVSVLCGPLHMTVSFPPYFLDVSPGFLCLSKLFSKMPENALAL
jgi:hypothetical protein